jgi:caffeoyl-CoA O-methyltransferase
MTRRTIDLTDELMEYVVANGSTPDPVMQDMIEETYARLPREAGMQIGPDQATFLTMLAKIVGAKHAVEVGTFTGMSALAIARGLVEGGKLLCCDISTEYTDTARKYWARAGVDDRIELRIAPAAETLATLPNEPYLDVSFIDADKEGYPRYWAEIVPRTRPGGLILVDNVLRDGRVLNPPPDDTEARAVVDFNKLVLDDDRVDAMILPLADGITLARKR